MPRAYADKPLQPSPNLIVEALVGDSMAIYSAPRCVSMLIRVRQSSSIVGRRKTDAYSAY